MVELVALDLALLKIQRDVQTAQSTETVQLVLLAGEAVSDLDVSEIDRRLLVRRLARAADQLLIVHAVVRRELVGLINVMLSSGRRGGRRRRQTLTRRRGWRRAHATLRRIGSLNTPWAHVLLLQGSGNAERHVALIPRGRVLATGRRSVLFPTSWLVLVVGMFAFVNDAQTIGLLDEGLLVVIGQKSPQFSQCFRQLGVVKLRILIGQFSPRSLSPHHERVHRSLDVGRSFVTGALGSDRYQSPVVSLKNFGDGGADSLAAIGGHRCGRGRYLTVVVVDAVVIVVTVVVSAQCRRDRRARALWLDVVHLHPFSSHDRVSRKEFGKNRSSIYRAPHEAESTSLISRLGRTENRRSISHCRAIAAYRFIIVASARHFLDGRNFSFLFFFFFVSTTTDVADLFAIVLSRLINFARHYLALYVAHIYKSSRARFYIRYFAFLLVAQLSSVLSLWTFFVFSALEGSRASISNVSLVVNSHKIATIAAIQFFSSIDLFRGVSLYLFPFLHFRTSRQRHKSAALRLELLINNFFVYLFYLYMYKVFLF